MQYVMGHPIWIKNSDPIKHNVVWIERCSIRDSIAAQAGSPAVGLRMKSAYVLIRNTDISYVNGRTIDIVFDSETRNRVAEATVAQNTLRYSTKGGVIYIENTGVQDAQIWLLNNNIQQNRGQDEDTVVQMVNVSVIMASNVLFNNSGRYILQLGRSGLGNILSQNITNNIFWFNAAQQQAARYTVIANASMVTFMQNLLNNPANSYEFSGQNGTPSPAMVNCSYNWWGTGLPDQVKAKLRSSENTQGLPPVTYKPYWTYPPSQFGVSCKFY